MTRQAKSTPTAQASRGLVNLEVTPNSSLPTSAKGNTPPKRFTTHIPEPGWQRVISLVVVVSIVALELWFLLRYHK